MLLVLALSLALAACGRATSYPASYEPNFMNACQVEGGSAELCGCVWEKIESGIPLEEFQAMETAIQSGAPHPLTERILQYREECRASG